MLQYIKHLYKLCTRWEYRYFNRKSNGVNKMIADLEFKRYKTMEIREEVRQAYDQTQHRLDILKQQIKKEEEAKNKEQAEHLDVDVKKVEKDAERYQAQMKQMDLDVVGSRPTSEMPEGYEGINQQLEHLRELGAMIRSYMKQNV